MQNLEILIFYLPELGLNIHISIKGSPGNGPICPGNVSGGPGNVSQSPGVITVCPGEDSLVTSGALFSRLAAFGPNNGLLCN